METTRTTNTDQQRTLKRRSKATYLTVSIGVAVLFAVAALLRHYATAVAFEAAAWAFLLSMIVSMPLSASFWTHRLRQAGRVDAGQQ
jgi:hypothetical protein